MSDVVTGYTTNGEPVVKGNGVGLPIGSVTFSPCRQAHELVHGDRQDAYGHPGPLYTKVGRAWAAILDVPEIDAETVLVMMAVLKAVRFSHRGGEDSLTDLAGYAEAIALVRGK